jgi:hypothetical protein
LAGAEVALIGAVVMIQAGTQAQPADQMLDLAVVETFMLAGRAEALRCELAGDRGVAQAFTGQCLDPFGQRRVVRQLVDPGHRAEQRGMGLMAAGPGHGGLDAFGGAVGGDLDGLDDGTQQPLAVRNGGRRRGPQRRDVAGQGADRGQFGRRQPGRALPLIPLVLLA